MPHLWMVLLLLLIAANVQAVTRYMATNGDDVNNTCAESTSESTPKATFASALPCMAAGDTLYLRGGTYTQQINSNNYSIANGTSWANAITIASYPNETAIIRPSGGSDAIAIADVDWIIFDRLTIDGANVTESSISHGSSGGHHMRITNCDVKNSDAPNIFAGDNSEILNNLIHDSQNSYGLYIWHSGVLIEGNSIYNNAGYAIQLHYDGPYIVHNNIVRNNRMYNNGFGRSQSAMTISSGNDNIAYNNLIYNNFGGIDLRGIRTLLYNNTLYNNSPRSAIEAKGTVDAIIRNNILYQNSSNITQIAPNTNLTQSNNPITNPLFVNAGAANFKLQAGSPAINTGFTVGAVTVDFDGIARPQGAGYDVGAYEFTSGAATPLHLVFTAPPVTTPEDTVMPPVQVCAKDPTEVTDTSFVASISLSITTNPASGTLTGGTGGAATLGCRSFPALSIDNDGNGYQLTAAATGATSIVSPLFNITDIPVPPPVSAPQDLKVPIAQ